MKPKAIFCWSGGKDSSYALHQVLSEASFEIIFLLTTINRHFKRVSMHGVREELLDLQTQSIGLPLVKVYVAKGTNEEYESEMAQAFLNAKSQGVETVIFGDIFLEDLKDYREKQLAILGMKAYFPLWKKDTKLLVEDFIHLGFKSITCCVSDQFLDERFVGRSVDAEFVEDLPQSIDPCGENGEYHSFCFDGPIFKFPIQFTIGEKVHRPPGFWFIDLLPLSELNLQVFSITDQLGRTITLPNHPPQRIVSLVPSLTELLYDLGLDQEVVGITKFCIHPTEWFKTKSRVGGTKQVSFESIAELQPDLIIANKEENQQQQVEALMQDYPVWISDIATLAQALEMIQSVGKLVGRERQANEMVHEIQDLFNVLLSDFSPNFIPRGFPISKLKSAIYLICNDPLMAAGKGTFIDDMLQYAGFSNVLQSNGGRYPLLTIEEIRQLQPEYLLLSSEPFPFAAKHLDYFKAELPATKILLVDGEYFSWYGSRLKEAAGYFMKLRQ